MRKIPRLFLALCAVDFSARVSYNMARTPVLPLFAAALGAGPALVGLIVAASTITRIFLKAPAGAISDHLGRGRTLLAGAALGVFGTIADAGQALGPILIGGLLELAGYLPAFAASC